MRLPVGIFLAILLIILQPPNFVQAAPLTLQDIVGLALKNSPELSINNHRRTISDLKTGQSRAEFFPKLNASTSYGYGKEDPVVRQSQWVSRFQLGLSQKLYDNGNTLTQYRLAEIAQQEADLDYNLAREKLCLDGAIAFYALARSQQLLQIQEEQYKLLQTQFKNIKSSYQQGLKTRQDYLRLQTQVTRADYDLLLARETVANARRELQRLIGTSEPLPNNLTVIVPTDSEDIKNIPKEKPTWEKHLYAKSTHLKSEAANINVQYASRRQWPDLDLSLNANYGSSDYWRTGQSFNDQDGWRWEALLTLSYDIIDWGIRRREKELALTEQAIVNDENRITALSITQDIDTLMADLDRLKTQYAMSQNLLKLEEDNLTLLDREYRQGKVQYLDYINALQDMTDAKVRYFSSLLDLKSALARYRYHEGTLYDSLKIH